MRFAREGSWSAGLAVLRAVVLAAALSGSGLGVPAAVGAEPPGPAVPSPPAKARNAPKDGVVSPPIVGWRVPEGCPEAQAVAERARRLAGHDAEAWARAGTVRGSIVSEAGGWVLSLEIGRGLPDRGSQPLVGGRVFRAADCDALAEAAAVAIALALGGSDGPAPPSPASAPATPAAPPELEPSAPASSSAAITAALAAPSEPEPATPASPVSVTVTPATHPAPKASSRSAEVDTEMLGMDSAVAEGTSGSSRQALGLAARAGALVDLGSLGGAALGGSVEVGLQRGVLGLGVYGMALPSRQIELAPSQSVALSLWALGLRGCLRAVDAGPTLDVCAGAEAGALGAQGKNLIDASTRRDVWAAATSGASFGVELAAHWHAGARLEAVLPLSRTRYLVNGDEPVYEIPAASVRGALSIGGVLGWR